MGNIVLLDELTINKIAAGEVIERPASVIKEMLENSIDAGATKVTVEIRNGGISYIKITDNGKGIAQDDLEMAFERHATSKIRTADDLDTVMTMGFRGEALASIAAISSVELISKTENQENGYKVFVEGGHVKGKEEIGCPTGTSITVKNLFFNTPVRYKFLKKDFTEAGYIEDIVTRIALINTNVAIKLVNTGKTVISTPGNGKIKDVIYSIYGKDVAEGILDVDYKYEDIIISGVIGKPENSRSNRSNQLFFVNNRFVKDRILTSATEQAYKNLLEMGKFAFLVLNIEMPTKDVDVNVHPAKLEVRFSNENKIYKAVFHAIQDTLEKFKNNNSTITKVDNLIIQENIPIKETVTPIKNEEEPREKRFSSFLNKRRNKYGLWESNNIIEDLYNKKKTEEVSIDISEIENKEENNKDIIEEKVTDNQEENIVNTSDVLQELRDINNSIKKDAENEASKAELIANEEIAVEENKIEEIEEKKELPDGTTYTYEGENKEK
ncbi:MAG: DNA mismatch repair endonuclease MutL, partial [Clostridia bacterium]|nr:DNA mismatch repair endonuclease MutL [Clostridia bacterium]